MASPEEVYFVVPALDMLDRYRQPSPDASEQRLVSGLPFSLHVLAGSNAHEGLAVAVVVGNTANLVEQPGGPLIRLHSACQFSEIGESLSAELWLTRLELHGDPSQECDCRAQRLEAQRRIAFEGGVYFDLLEQEGRGAGLDVKRKAYELQRTEGLDTDQTYRRLRQPFDARAYGHCALFLLGLGLNEARLMSNNPRKRRGLQEAGVTVTLEPHIAGVTAENRAYLETKRDKAGHLFPSDLGPHLSD